MKGCHTLWLLWLYPRDPLVCSMKLSSFIHLQTLKVIGPTIANPLTSGSFLSVQYPVLALCMIDIERENSSNRYYPLPIPATMSHCHDEHVAHGGHGHHHHEHDHSDDITPALQYSLYDQINFDAIETFNESVQGSGKAITKKTWAERMQPLPEVHSDADEQLIISVPYV
jgi:hypothetical protein